jgi:hypothetical protein
MQVVQGVPATRAAEGAENMATQSGRPVAFNEALGSTSDAHQLGDSIVKRSSAWLKRCYCGLHGHDHLLQFGHERMFLLCVSCGHESPGWELNEAPPKPALRGDARQHALIRPQLVGARQRVA